MKRACGLCGRDPAAGFATVGDKRYCHGDFDPEPTCYMRAQYHSVAAQHYPEVDRRAGFEPSWRVELPGGSCDCDDCVSEEGS